MTGAILVTGATGFVGRALLAALADEPRPVVALVRTYAPDLPAHVIQRIAPDIETLDQDQWLGVLEGISHVVHLAGIAHIGPEIPEARYDAVNHRATAALGAACVVAGVKRLVFASSIRAQCGASSPIVQTETSTPAPTDAYGRAKLAAERALQQLPLDCVILRPTLIVGPEPKGNLRLLVRLAATGWPLPFASLSGKRSMISLGDVVAVLRRALDDAAMTGGTFILAEPAPFSFGDMISHIRTGLGMGRRLFPLPEMLMSLPFALIGRGDMWQRIGGNLVAQPDGLRRIGFTSVQPVAAALAGLGAAQRR